MCSSDLVKVGVAGRIFFLVRRRDLEFDPKAFAEDPPALDKTTHRVAASLVQRTKVLGPLLELRETAHKRLSSRCRLVTLLLRPLSRRRRIVDLHLCLLGRCCRNITILLRPRGRRHRAVALPLHLRGRSQSGVSPLLQFQHLRTGRVPLPAEPI